MSLMFWAIIQCSINMCIQDYRKFDTKQKCEAQAKKDMKKNHTILKCIKMRKNHE